MLQLAHFTILLVFCSVNVFGEQNDTRAGRYYDVFDARSIPLAHLLSQNEVPEYGYVQYNNHHLLNEDNLPVFRQNLLGLSKINSAWGPIANLLNSVPRPFVRNPDLPTLTNAWRSCQDDSGLDGTCVPATLCGKLGGTPSGTCGLGSVCCVNSINRCGGQVTMNNTYWQSPTTVSSSTTCGLTVTLDNNLIEQKSKICQVRLDFVTFTTAQPNAQSVCNVDTFRVGGATNNVPIICGDNDGQHMYLNLASPVSQLQLLFNFGSSSVTRSWNIKISMLPCGASFLAPKDCLQYFTQTNGNVKSFNWKDVAGTATRQLANQDYRICFRPGLVSNAAANRMCITPCTVTAASTAFSLSFAIGGTPATGTADKSQGAAFTDCNNDYIVLEDGFDPAVSSGTTCVTSGGATTCNVRDRFCGERLNVAAFAASSATVCSIVKPFTIVFRTNGDETVTDTKDSNTANADPANGNLGFCLSFSQRSL